MFCKKCGAQIKDGAKFCPKCGTKIASGEGKSKDKSGKNFKKSKKRYGFTVGILAVFAVAGVLVKLFVLTPSEGTSTKALSDGNKVIERAEVDYVLQGIGGKVEIEGLSGDETEAINNVAGIRGEPIDITVRRQQVESAVIKFFYDEEKVEDAQAEKFKIAYYNEELGRMELLNTRVDTQKHMVSVETTHFSRYVVVDSDEWYEAWIQSQLLIRDEGVARNYFDIIFTLDCSGSMDGTDKNGLSKQCTYDFIKQLYDGDFFTVLKFSDTVEPVLYGQRIEEVTSWESIQQTIQGITAGGGTNIENALSVSREYSDGQTTDAAKLIVLLSDGQASVGDEVISEIKNEGIKVLTIGFGDDADEELLMHIADETGGSYYKVGEDDIASVFEKIREEYVGVDLENDSDNDGIPDKVETTGMRNQYGKVICTDPNDPDTDGDGISDGVEAGKIVIDENVTNLDRSTGLNKYVYFEMTSDPTVYDKNTEYNPQAVIELSGEPDENAENVNIEIEISNGAAKISVDKESKNRVNDIENPRISLSYPACMTTEDSEIKLDSIASGESKTAVIAFQHNSQKCDGEKHVVVAKIRGDNITETDRELRLSGMYWYEKIDIDDDTPVLQLIEKVRAYSSSYDEHSLEEVFSDSSLPPEEIRSFWDRQRSDLTMRWRLNYLCNDDIYVAHAFRMYMEDKGIISKGVLELSKIVFNDGVVNKVINHPEKNRYKQMLLEYINYSMEDVQNEFQISALMKGYSGVISSYNGLSGELMNQQMILSTECRTALDTINSNLEYLNGADKTVEGISSRIGILVEQGEILRKGGVEVNVTETVKSDVLEGLENEYNRLNNIKKAAGAVGLAFNISSDAIEMYNNVTRITATSEAYQEYENLLGLIAEKTKYPELKEAAEELQVEMRNQYKLYADESWNFMMKTGINVLSTLSGIALSDFAGAASNIVSTAGLTATVGKFLLNATLGIDDLLESSVYVIGASEVADILSQRLLECRDEFNTAYYRSMNEAYQTALDFQYYYTHLQKIRIYGEEQYLKMKGMDGAMEVFGDLIKEWNDYEEAHEICTDTIEKIEDMKF
ncbi:hypothetical protein B5F07_08730 [Lachnoclostridium sp. An169]|uniref:VWA domain-containing protein n=1 Tax=Lachnoclostridium sp. An169 TaxID=1965569 RepID=UPI000B3904D8|nr:VWA domain-containing protein [Lachnoclostridium sp. An169]OUP84226.1 hypothetical protein B5F07_08730 [Lachnoclostridium sp. An169]